MSIGGSTGLRLDSRGLPPALEALVEESLSVLRTLEGFTWLIGYSGGKDSTVVLHLAAEALAEGVEAGPVVAVYNDTMDELPRVRRWALETLRGWERYLRGLGVEAYGIATRPPLRDLYMWRIVVRGYPPPTWKFRWCTNLLKIMPTKRAIEWVRRVAPGRPMALLIGSRDGESAARRVAHRRRAASCPVGGCIGLEVLSNDMGVVKVPVIRRWSDADVWGFLESREPPWREPGYHVLVGLYGEGRRARFGCWHCLVAARHRGLEEEAKYSEAMSLAARVRAAIRMLADQPGARLPKEKGGYGQGPLHPKVRMAIHAIAMAAATLHPEELYWAWEPLEAPPHGELSYAQVFQAPPREASRLAREIDGSRRAEWLTPEAVEELQALTAKAEEALRAGQDPLQLAKLNL